MNAIFQLVNPSNTITINRPLAHALGLNEAVVYGALISKYYYYSERGLVGNGGWFYSTAPDLQESTALSEKQQKRAIDNLINAGLIRSELRGMPAKRSFYIVEDIALLQKIISDGEEKICEIKPAAAERYEKKRQSPETSEPNPQTQSLIDFLSAGLGTTMSQNELEDNSTENACEAALLHCSDKRAEQAPPKGQSLLRQKGGASSDKMAEQHFIKSNINNLNIINPSITRTPAREEADALPDIDEADKMDLKKQREECLELLKENISYYALCEQCKSDKTQIDELLSIMLEVICSTKPTVRVNGEELPAELVKSVFLKLNENHIDYVLDALKKNTSDVRNIRAYLITALYNAPNTMDSYYQAWVNHDMRGGSL